ncbi:MAG: CRISPR-associated endonuclease Cas1 [Runella sp.]
MELVVAKRGTSLSISNGRFRVRNPEQEIFVPVHQVRAICLHPATKVTYEAMMTALEHDIDLMLIDRKGHPAGRLWGGKFGSISTIRKNQLAFSTHAASLEWIRQILIRKADNQIAVVHLLHALHKENASHEARAAALKTIERYRDKFKYHQSPDRQDTLASFRGYEGSMSRAYFEYVSSVLPEKYRFKKRSQHPALDAFNCLLNYAYGMLYANCESALIKAGLDPAVGIMHRDEYNRPVLVYDFIENYRAWADYVVCHLFLQEVVYDEFFEVQSQQYWLNNIGKRILIQAMNDYLEEVIVLQGLSRSRLTHISLDAQKLAQQIKKFSVPSPYTSHSKPLSSDEQAQGEIEPKS